MAVWIFEAFRKYAEFSGRSRRKEYWGFFLATLLFGMAAGLIDAAAFGSGFDTGLGPAAIVLFLALLVPSLALSVRRLHDIDFSGWWLLLSIIPYVNILIFLIIGLVDGTAGENRFGPDPKNRLTTGLSSSI